MKDIESLPKVYIRGNISPKGGMFEGETFSALDLIEFLKTIPEEPAFVAEISSNGGYRAEGVEIYSILKNCGKEVITVANKANSIATVVMLGGSTRLVSEFAPFNVHFARIDPKDLGMDFLTADDLGKLKDETERADRQIVDIYCSELGEDKRGALLAAMTEEMDLGARGAIKLGFATGYYKKKKKEKVDVENYKSILITDHLGEIIQNFMEDKKATERLSAMEKLIKNLVKFVTGDKVKNEIKTLSDGVTQVDIQVTDPEQPTNYQGATVKLVVDGVPTEDLYPDGETTLEDGTTLVVSAGTVTEVKGAVDLKKMEDEIAAAKASLLEKETALQNAQAEVQALKDQMKNKDQDAETIKTEMKKQVDIIKNEFDAFKKQVPGDRTAEPKEAKVVDMKNMSPAQIFIQNRLEQLKQK